MAPSSTLDTPPSEQNCSVRAILVIDIVGSVPLIKRHGYAVVERWNRFVDEVRREVLSRHGVRLVKSLGDGLRLVADDGSSAVAAALDIRTRLQPYNHGCDQDGLLLLHTGIHVAEIVETELDIFGHGVNIAARLAGNSEPGEVLLSGETNETLLPGLDAQTEDLGERWLKGLDEPVRTYRVADEGFAEETLSLVPDAGVLRVTLAVLPFDSPTPNESGLSIGELLADDLICALSLLPDVQVVSRLSTSAIARRKSAEPDVATVLRADFVLSGNCYQSGEQLVVHAELFDARRREVIDRFRVSAQTASLLSPESPIVESLIQRMATALLARQIDRARRCALPNLAGYTLLLGGIALMHRLGRRDFARAGELLTHLCERWPRLAAPHAWRARWHLFSVLQGFSMSPDADRLAARGASQRALDLDDASSVALAVAGSVRIGLERDVDAGLALYAQALHANPSDSFAWMLCGTGHAFKGEGRDAQQASAQAIRLSPLDPMHFLYDCHAAAAALAADDSANACRLALRSMRANAQHLSTYRVLAIAQMLEGDGDGARDTVRRLRQLDARASVDGYLRNSPSAAYPIGQRFARLLGEAGLPQSCP